MTDIQKITVTEMRKQGAKLSEISETTGVREGTVKSYCWRHNIKPGQPLPPKSNKNHCQNCGQLIVQEPKTKPKKFCCDKCRSVWWNKNRRYFSGKIRTAECAYCKKRFVKSGNTPQRFCNHACYINSRFGEAAPK